MTDQTEPQFVLITQDADTYVPENVSVYGPSTNLKDLESAGKLLTAGSSPPMTYRVYHLQQARWDDA